MNERTWTALGDSFTAGTGDSEGGWIARTYAAVARQDRLDRLVNLARPGLTISTVVDENPLGHRLLAEQAIEEPNAIAPSS